MIRRNGLCVRNEAGQAMVEYVIMAVVFCVVLVWFARAAPIAVGSYYKYFAFVMQSPFP